MDGTSQKIVPPAYERLLADYRTLPGIADELLDASGQVRPVWHGFLNELAAFSPDDLEHAFARGNQYLRDAGVFFRHYGPGASTEREWPLSHIPLIIKRQEWENIASSLMERADLLEQVIADFYSENRLVGEGILPAGVLAANPEWLRPLVGVKPKSGHFLHFIAFDIGRGPDGNWWVLGDRTQAPSGSGFALETRMATARSFSSLMNHANVARLAGFFRQFRDSLLGLREQDGSRVAILTPGPLNDTYYEHAYIARYLGFMLVQGSDLAVRNGKLMVRTVGGLKPVSVLWRRVDSEWIDPLELNDESRLGAAGMTGALRSGSFTMVNAAGSGALEIRALMAFIPKIAQHLTGKPLSMPNIATWWCGGNAELDYVKANLSRMLIDRAMSTRLPFDHSPQAILSGRMRDGTPVDPGWIDVHGEDLVAQEAVSLSTTPAFSNGKLVARPMSLRVFLARTPNGWSVMPGGFARIGSSGGSADISMQRGGSVSDVWVVSDTPETQDTLIASSATGYLRPELGSLPTTAADNLFWLGRYVERTEHSVRLLRAYHLRLAETGTADYPIARFLGDHIARRGIDPDTALPAQLLQDIESAIRSAGNVRDRFSNDGWNALVDLKNTARMFASKVQAGDDAARAYSILLRKISGFSGLVHENMYRFTGWRFLGIGRSVERIVDTLDFLNSFTDEEAPIGAFELAIEVGDSIMTHRRRFAVETRRETVVDLLLLDDMNPRAVLNQLRVLNDHAAFLPAHEGERTTAFQRRIMELVTALSTSTANDIPSDRLAEISAEAGGLSSLLAESYLR
ncbi:MAG: circularly permuted type 2 ATP-grasp protein [Nitratireductor sp.]|nr:circularly permuted type 2 ATP-grasp protein [Nitratireductor sp.]